MAHQPSPPNPSDDVVGHVTQLLEQLGRTDDQVATTLELGGFHGDLKNCGACPVANYLYRCDLRPYSVLVGDFEAEVFLTPAGPGIKVDLPKAVSYFVSNFDEGLYPSLVKDRPGQPQPPVRDFDLAIGETA